MLRSLANFLAAIVGIAFVAFLAGLFGLLGVVSGVWLLFRMEDKHDGNTDTRPGPSTVVNPVVEMKPTRTRNNNSNGSKPNV